MICKNRGEPIRSVEALARSAYKSGEWKLPLRRPLIWQIPDRPPSGISNTTVTRTVAPTASALARSHPKSLLNAHLSDFRMMQPNAEELLEHEKSYTPEDWAYLTAELAKFKDTE